MPRSPRFGPPLPILALLLAAVGCGADASSDAGRGPGYHLLAVSANHACAWRHAGVYCWTIDLGAEDGFAKATPVRVELEAGDVVELAAGSGQTCARRRSGEVVCWKLGEQKLEAPVRVLDLDDARQLAVDTDSACALREDASVACFGPAVWEGMPMAEPIPGLSSVAELRAGGQNAYCARTLPAGVHCYNVEFDGAGVSSAREVPTLAGATAIAMSFGDAVCGILPSSEIQCANPDTGQSTPLADSRGSVELRAAGGLSACAKDAAEQWHCWNVLPTADAGRSLPKTAVPSEQPLIELGITGFILCAVRQDGRVLCGSANSSAPELREVTGLPP